MSVEIELKASEVQVWCGGRGSRDIHYDRASNGYVPHVVLRLMTPGGVTIDLEGTREELASFLELINDAVAVSN